MNNNLLIKAAVWLSLLAAALIAALLLGLVMDGMCCTARGGELPPGVRVLPQARKKPNYANDVIKAVKDKHSTLGRYAVDDDDCPKWKCQGVEGDKLSEEPKILRKGKAITRALAMKLVEGKELPDDKLKLRLTIIGEVNERKRVEGDLNNSPHLAEFKGRVVYQGYDCSNWAVARYGFVCGGRPTIYIQAPDGTVLHRQDDYDDGPQGLAEALRKADPNYDSDKDPDLRKQPLPGPKVPDAPDVPDLLNLLKDVPRYAWVMMGAGLFLLYVHYSSKKVA